MIGLSGLGLARKPRRFDYKPRHFDPKAKEKEEMRKAILGENTNENQYQPGLLIKLNRMQRMQKQADQTAKKSKVGIIRAAIFLILVMAVLFFMSDILAILFVK